MDNIREFLITPLGGVFAFFLKAFVGALCVCGGIQLFNFRNLTSFFTIRKIVGLFLITIGVSRIFYVMFRF